MCADALVWGPLYMTWGCRQSWRDIEKTKRQKDGNYVLLRCRRTEGQQNPKTRSNAALRRAPEKCSGTVAFF